MLKRFSKCESFNQKFLKFWTMLEGSENGTKVLGKKFPKICVYLERLSYFPEISEEVDPFVARISQNPNMKFLVECEGQIN